MGVTSSATPAGMFSGSAGSACGASVVCAAPARTSVVSGAPCCTSLISSTRARPISAIPYTSALASRDPALATAASAPIPQRKTLTSSASHTATPQASPPAIPSRLAQPCRGQARPYSQPIAAPSGRASAATPTSSKGFAANCSRSTTNPNSESGISAMTRSSTSSSSVGAPNTTRSANMHAISSRPATAPAISQRVAPRALGGLVLTTVAY